MLGFCQAEFSRIKVELVSSKIKQLGVWPMSGGWRHRGLAQYALLAEGTGGAVGHIRVTASACLHILWQCKWTRRTSRLSSPTGVDAKPDSIAVDSTPTVDSGTLRRS